MNNQKVSCIVPVYNEGPRVLGVLDVIIASGLADEIIVVNDGSTDNTDEILKNKPGIKYVLVDPNQGKSHAVKVGFQTAKNDIVMMIDSDLLGLNNESLRTLIEPITSGTADMTISLRKNALRFYKWFGLDFVSGERVFNKNIIENMDDLDVLPGFGLESYLNQIAIKKNLRLKIVLWMHVISPRKSVKAGRWAGLKGDLGMARQITKYLTFSGTARMYRSMLKLRVK